MNWTRAWEIAFRIVIAHPDCLQDDAVLDELIEDIAAAIVDAAQEQKLPDGEHLGVDDEGREWKRWERKP
jgi:hypothetical protein